MPGPLNSFFASRSRQISSVAVLLIVLLALYTSSDTRQNHASRVTNSAVVENYTYPASAHPLAQAQTRPKRIAIIGAGASGSSVAFFMRRAGRTMEQRLKREAGELIGEVVVFERESYVGGRSTTVHPHGDERIPPVEIGASIFVEANKNMLKAAKHFGLEVREPDFLDAGLGIWDGEKFLFSTATSPSRLSGWWDTLSALRRYGALSPYRTKKAVASLLDKFAHLYDPEWLSKRGAVWSIDDFGEKARLGKDLTTRYGAEWAGKVGMGDKWIGEVMEGSTRVNYARDMDEIHALGAAVCMATGGAKQIAGGNWQVFDRMLKDAKADVRLSTMVTDIVPIDTDGQRRFRVETNSTAAQADELFDSVFFAAPWHLSPMSKSLAHHFEEKIPKQDYVHIHVTYLATTQPRPDPGFFNLPPDTILPTTILTSSSSSKAGTTPPPSFQSITWHTETYEGSGEYTVKIFSLGNLSHEFLTSLIGEEPLWVLRKEWDSYPKLGPISAFAPVQPMKGLHYLAAMEPWVSTMETQTISAREAVARVVEEWWGLGMGECKGGADAWDWTC